LSWLYFLTWKKRTTISGISDFTSQKTDWKLIFSERFVDPDSVIKRGKGEKKRKAVNTLNGLISNPSSSIN